MIIGGLSEKDFLNLTKLLDENQVSYNVRTDEVMIKSNKDSISHNLRHLNSPSISTSVLALEIEEQTFTEIKQDLKEILATDYGVTDSIPEEFLHMEFKNEIDEVHQKINKGRRDVIGLNFMHIMLLSAAIFLIRYIWKTYF